jgi:O-antigen/teichoic acid export membrane protein
MSGSRQLVRNGFANLTRGLSAGLVAVALPAVLVRALTPDAYSAWALVLQVAAYVGLLDLGLQVGIGRFIARETGRGDLAQRDAFYAAGGALLFASGLVGLIATAIFASCLPHLFPKLDTNLVPASRIAILLIGGSVSISLPGSLYLAAFIGMERFAIPAIILGCGRTLQVAAVAVASRYTHQLVPIAAAYAIGNLLMCAAYWAASRGFLHFLPPRLRAFRMDAARELARYCATLSLWNVSMFLVYGLDTAIVAEVDFRSVAPYSVCSNLMTVLIGLMGSAFNVLISRVSVLEGQGERRQIGRLLVGASKVGTLSLLAIGALALLAAGPALNLWIGRATAERALPFFWVLLAANGVRLFLVPYSTVLLGTGEHRWATATTLSEGVSNLVASVLLGRAMGPMGVAYGTLIGAAVGVAMALFYTFPRAAGVGCSRREYVVGGLLKPAACMAPCAAGLGLYLRFPGPISEIAFVAGIAVSALILVQAPIFRVARIRKVAELSPP